ncbi:hypothetical protein HanRHA438_Chr17g0824111 [Helianthus annuus]|nr:hypothetical protein HanPI659440_Chr17g0689871 [Helianthus annuus]KAJ0827301.1 hypothetical protein HanRHA438_Chr17g0824111 [Helianthus annuus]
MEMVTSSIGDCVKILQLLEERRMDLPTKLRLRFWQLCVSGGIADFGEDLLVLRFDTLVKFSLYNNVIIHVYL